MMICIPSQSRVWQTEGRGMHSSRKKIHGQLHWKKKWVSRKDLGNLGKNEMRFQ